MADAQVVSFEPSHCPTCSRQIDGIRRGLWFPEDPDFTNRWTPPAAIAEPPTIEPCGHTIDSYTVKVGEVTYER